MAGFGTGFGSLNKVQFIGRLTKDPRIGTTASQSKVANFGLAVSNRKKNPSTGQWEDVPMFFDVAVWNRGENGKQADFVEKWLHKGDLAFVEGRLEAPREWTGNDGVRHISMNVTADDVQFLAAPKDGPMRSSPPEGGVSRSFAPAGKPMSAPPSDYQDSYDSMPPEPAFQPPAATRPEEEIPF
jgi:single-strand DNA-binding protein